MHQVKFNRDKYITFNKKKQKHCCQLNSITTVIIKVIFNCRNTVHANTTCTCRHKFKVYSYIQQLCYNIFLLNQTLVHWTHCLSTFVYYFYHITLPCTYLTNLSIQFHILSEFSGFLRFVSLIGTWSHFF